MTELNLTTENFIKEVLESELPVLVDFWAQWCMPCQQIAPVIAELAKKYQNKVKVCKVNIEQAKELAIQYGVMGIPNLIFFKNGKKIDQLAGSVSIETIEKKIKERLLK